MKLLGFERRWARAVCDTIYPGPERGMLPYGVAQMELDAFFDDVLSNLPFEPAIGLHLAFWLIAFSPLFVIGRFALFSSLGADDRERVLAKIATSDSYAIRGTVIAIKAVLSLFYCGDARVRPQIWAVPEPAPQLVALKPRKADETKGTSKGANHEHHFA